MLFLSIFEYEPAKREEVVRKRMEMGPPQRPGVKMVGQWSYLGGGKVVTLVDADNMKVTYELMAPYTDLGKFEVMPVLETEEVLAVLKAQQKAGPAGV